MHAADLTGESVDFNPKRKQLRYNPRKILALKRLVESLQTTAGMLAFSAPLLASGFCASCTASASESGLKLLLPLFAVRD